MLDLAGVKFLYLGFDRTRVVVAVCVRQRTLLVTTPRPKQLDSNAEGAITLYLLPVVLERAGAEVVTVVLRHLPAPSEVQPPAVCLGALTLAHVIQRELAEPVRATVVGGLEKSVGTLRAQFAGELTHKRLAVSTLNRFAVGDAVLVEDGADIGRGVGGDDSTGELPKRDSSLWLRLEVGNRRVQQRVAGGDSQLNSVGRQGVNLEPFLA